MGMVTAGRQVAEIAAEVASTALAQFGQPSGEIIYTRRATQKRQALWKRLGLTPRAVDREITEVLHRTHEGVDLDAGEHPQVGPALLAGRRLGRRACSPPTSATSSSARPRR